MNLIIILCFHSLVVFIDLITCNPNDEYDYPSYEYQSHHEFDRYEREYRRPFGRRPLHLPPFHDIHEGREREERDGHRIPMLSNYESREWGQMGPAGPLPDIDPPPSTPPPPPPTPLHRQEDPFIDTDTPPHPKDRHIDTQKEEKKGLSLIRKAYRKGEEFVKEMLDRFTERWKDSDEEKERDRRRLQEEQRRRQKESGLTGKGPHMSANVLPDNRAVEKQLMNGLTQDRLSLSGELEATNMMAIGIKGSKETQNKRNKLIIRRV